MSQRPTTRASSKANSQASVAGDTPARQVRRGSPQKTPHGSKTPLPPVAATPSLAYGTADLAPPPGEITTTEQPSSFISKIGINTLDAVERDRPQAATTSKKAGSRASNASSRVRKAVWTTTSTVNEESEPDAQEEPAAAPAAPGDETTTTTAYNKELSGFGHTAAPLAHGESADPGPTSAPTSTPAPVVTIPSSSPPRLVALRQWATFLFFAGSRLLPYLIVGFLWWAVVSWGLPNLPGAVQDIARIDVSVGGLAERLTVLETGVSSLRETVVYSSTSASRQETTAPPPERMVNFFATGLGVVVDPYYTSPTMYPPSTWKQDVANRVFFLGRPIPNAPIAALEGWADIGDCWCSAHSKDGKAQLAVLMPRPIYPTKITVDHIPATATLDVGAAPRDMELWAQILDEDARGQMIRSQAEEVEPVKSLGPTFVRIANWQYDIHAASNVQTFDVDVDMRSFGAGINRAVVRAKSNDGTSEYTCLYRVRLHGELAN